MGKRKFNIGEFVWSNSNSTKHLLYIYNYRSDFYQPYQLVGERCNYYTANARQLRPINTLDNLMNSLLRIRPLTRERFVREIVLVNSKKYPPSHAIIPLNWDFKC